MKIRERAKNFVSGLNMKNKLISVVSAATLIPLVIIFVLSASFYMNKSLRDYEADAQRRLAGTVRLMNDYLNTAFLQCDNILSNPYIVGRLSADYGGDISGVIDFYNMLEMLFSADKTRLIGIDDHFIIYTTNPTLPEGKFVCSIDRIKDDKSLADFIGASSDIVRWSDGIFENEYGQKYFSLYRNFPVFDSYIGLVEYRIPIKKMTALLDEFALLPRENLTYRLRSGEKIWSSQNPSAGVTVTENFPCGHTISVSMPKRYICAKDLTNNIFYFSVILLFLAGAYFLTRMMIKRVTNELYDFISDIQENQLLVLNENLIETNGSYEISIIKEKFKELLSTVHSMYKEILEISENKRILELELLQTNLNPHMLYNSLSSIRWNLLRCGETKMAEMVDTMVNYYRSVLSNGNSVITVREEIRLISDYIAINEISYQMKIELEVDIGEDLLNTHIVKLLFQPIAENAVIHGLNGKDDGKIYICGRRENGKRIFTIEDNGYGMDPEVAESLMNLSYKAKFHGYGVQNTIKRIKNYYGEEYGLTIESVKGMGTKVEVIIPEAEKSEGGDVQ